MTPFLPDVLFYFQSHLIPLPSCHLPPKGISHTYLHIVDLRHPQEWTRSHLDWFNMHFSPTQYHTIPLPHSPRIRDNEQILAKVVALVNEYREYLVPQEWNCTLPFEGKGKSVEKGKDVEKARREWIEVSARPGYMIQLFVFSVIKLLLQYLGSEMEIQRYTPSTPGSFLVIFR